MNYLKIASMLCFLIFTSSVYAADENPDLDETPVKNCEELNQTASINFFSKTDTAQVCRELLRVLDGVRIKDLHAFSKAAYLLSQKGYEESKFAQITHELVEIIRLRGLYNKQDRWYSTVNIIYKSWVAFNGAVSPRTIVAFLQSSGSMAKTLSDDGLISMIIVMKNQYQEGN